MITALSVNFLGDALRDIFDVRQTDVVAFRARFAQVGWPARLPLGKNRPAPMKSQFAPVQHSTRIVLR